MTGRLSEQETKLGLATLTLTRYALNSAFGGGEKRALNAYYPQFPRGSTLITPKATLITRPSIVR
jgi:hypothetical protein